MEVRDNKILIVVVEFDPICSRKFTHIIFKNFHVHTYPLLALGASIK